MIRIKDIQNSLYGLIGFRGDHDNGRICEYMQRSESGLFYEDEHAMLTANNIRNIVPMEWKPIVPRWKENELYEADNMVCYGGRYYVCKGKTLANPLDTSIWQELTDFEVLLRQKASRSIAKLVNRFLDDKKTELETKSLLESKYLFNQTGRIGDTITKKGRIVGLELSTPKFKSVSTRIHRIGIQTKGIGEMDIYLFHNSNPVPVAKKRINKTINGAMQWYDVDWVLPYVSETQDSGGAWYVCYWEDDLGEMQAVKKNYDFAKQPCTSCNGADYANYQAWSRYLGVNPFYVNGEGDRELWDIANNIYTSDNNYGLNLSVGVECDLTDFIIEQRGMFANALSKQFAVDMLSDMYYNGSGRINYTTQNGNYEKLDIDLNGDGVSKKTGMKYELEQAITALKVDVRGIDEVCLPCRRKGIKFGKI